MTSKFSFTKQSRLLRKSQFQEIAHSKDKKVGRLLVVNTLQAKTKQARLGITVTRRFGKAHLRNRFKRKVREAFRLLELPSNLHLHVKPRMDTSVHHASMQEIQEEIKTSISKRREPLDGCN